MKQNLKRFAALLLSFALTGTLFTEQSVAAELPSDHQHTLYYSTLEEAEVDEYGSWGGYYEQECEGCDYTTGAEIPAVDSVSLSATSYTFDGKTKKPTVTVKDIYGEKISSKYYTVSYSSGRKAPGTYHVTVDFQERYIGSTTLSFTIKQSGTTISSVTAGKNQSVTVKWKKSASASGYEVQYSTSSSFSGAKTLSVSKDKTSTTIKGLKAGTKYYFRIRVVKKANDITGKSSWSGKKSVSTAKKATSSTSASASTSSTVYITNTGKKYHRSNCRYLRQSKIKTTKSSAKSRGYTPCSICQP